MIVDMIEPAGHPALAAAAQSTAADTSRLTSSLDRLDSTYAVIHRLTDDEH